MNDVFAALLQRFRDKPAEIVLGLSMIALAIGGGAIGDVASSSAAVFALFGFANVHRVRRAWQSLVTGERLLLLMFLAFFLSGVLSYLNVEDTYEYNKCIERYLRFGLLVLIVLAVFYHRLDLRQYLFVGIVISGPVYLAIALHSLYTRPLAPPSGDYHHITFGGAAMANAMLMLLMLVLERWSYSLKLVTAVSMMCALYASFLSTARGAWMAIPVAVVIVLLAATSVSKPVRNYIVGMLLVIVGSTAISPASDIIRTRLGQAVNEVEMFVGQENAATSVGQRFAYWDVAFDIWKKTPLLGTGLGDFDDELYILQDQGVYPDIDVSGSVHNIFVQSLVETGLIGLAAIVIALLVMPLWNFIISIRRGDMTGYYGVMLIVVYTIFGLSETWIIRAPVTAGFIIYFSVLVASCMVHARASDE